MWWRRGIPVVGGLICIATLATADAGPSIVPAGPPLAPRTHGFMLYVSQPVGGGPGVGGAKLGFRIEQVRMTGNNGAPDAGDPMQHRSIIGWQFGGLHASDMHLELGGRVSYDVRHGGFTLQSSSRIPHPVSSRSNVVTNVTLRGAKPFDAHGPDEHAMPGRMAFSSDTRESASLLHEIAAAAVIHLHSNPVQQRDRPGNRLHSPRD